MKKKWILVSTCGLLLMIATAGVLIYIIKTTTKAGTLYVNGNEITSENVTIHSNYADLPFTEVLRGLGINIEWVDNNTAELTCNGQKYTLDLDEASLTDYGCVNNFLIPAPGSTTFNYTVLEKELVIDSNTIHSIMYAMENNVSISIDQKKSIVYVTERTD
jgi:hypothetical protein